MDKLFGLKNIVVKIESPYPIVSAYEFEFLKMERPVKKRLKDSTVYVIAQRPTLYFDSLEERDGVLFFKIKDGSSKNSLDCELPIYQKALGTETSREYRLNPHFFSKVPPEKPPYNGVAGFKILSKENEFISWFTPYKIIYQAALKTMTVSIQGDIRQFCDYKVHYIGQAFDRKVWERLTGHEKMQSVLTVEAPSVSGFVPSMECVLIFFRVAGYDEQNIVTVDLPKEAKPFAKEISDENDIIDLFTVTPMNSISKQLTNDVEARLIKMLKPKYNIKRYENYPGIKEGLRSVGYYDINLEMQSVSELYTDVARIELQY